MRLIAIDSSTRHRLCCVAVSHEGGELTWGGRVVRGVAVDVALPPLLAELVAGGVDGVAAVVGPGSRAGIRVGVAAALGLVVGRPIGVHPIGALDVVAHASLAAGDQDLDARVLWAVADASRGGLFVAPYSLVAGGVRRLELPQRVEAASWQTPGGTRALALEGFATCPAGVGALDGEVAVVDGLARAALAALDVPALDIAALACVGD